ncbi:hypothetical protein HY993_02200 [Candidatus Micrarchaeota archaeon]|nr:hypothetical protein [Candidatus Micrarchaeota archaeon]
MKEQRAAINEYAKNLTTGRESSAMYQAINALGRIALKDEQHAPQVIRHLKKILEEDKTSNIHTDAIRNLEGIAVSHEQHAPVIIRQLAKTMTDSRTNIKYRTTAALGKIASEHEKHARKIIPLPVKALTDNEEIITGEAASALKNIGSRMLEKNPVFDENHEHYHFLTALKHVKPTQYPNAFSRLFKDLKNQRYKNKPKEWWAAHAKQLRSTEKIIKAA